ncbi:MAG: hypothetical protein WCG99_03400 [Candidatus Berkelbacteria bacterium]
MPELTIRNSIFRGVLYEPVFYPGGLLITYRTALLGYSATSLAVAMTRLSRAENWLSQKAIEHSGLDVAWSDDEPLVINNPDGTQSASMVVIYLPTNDDRIIRAVRDCQAAMGAVSVVPL